eukprot:8223333-Lingulodinium_polyedra.AAC.1
MVYQTNYQRVCGVVRVFQDIAATAVRDAATQARVVALYQAKTVHAAQLSTGGGMDHETFIRECYMIYEH